MSGQQAADSFVQKVGSGKATTAVVGLGYVGLPLALLAAHKLQHVVGVDVDGARIESIAARKSYIGDISDAELAAAVDSGKFTATADYAALQACDAIVICVPTPLHKTGGPDLSFIVQSVDAIAQHMSAGKLVVLESTSYPGTTDELVCPRLQANGLVVGRDFWLAFSPERINPGPEYSQFHLPDVPKVVGGVTPECTRVAAAFYRRIMRAVVEVSNSRVAEMVKLLENTYRSVNIALVNELAQMSRELGIDIWEVVDAAKTKPYGFQAFYPGPGLGGHCIPIDPLYLAWKARLYGFEPRFIDLAARVNSEMPRYVAERAADLLNQHNKPLNGARVHILGVTYKRDVSDTRESPAFMVMKRLVDKGAQVSYSDHHAPRVELEDGSEVSAVPLDQADLSSYDLVLIITDHSDFPYEKIVWESKLILDTRNVLRKFRQSHIHRL